MFKVIIGVVIATVVLLVVMSQVNRYVNTSNQSEISLVSDDPNKLTITVSGEVTRPGTYLMEVNTDLGDLLQAASGATTNADELAYDVSYLLEDDQSFYIAPKYDNGNACTIDPIAKVNINKDDKSKLMTINAIGDTVASNLISYRQGNSFKRIEDVKNVNGIGPATFEKIKNYITIK